MIFWHFNSSFSGTGYDRWSYEQSSHHAGANDNALNKLQHKFWVTKTKVVRKFGKEEDKEIVASDAELDAKLELFLSIHETTCRLEHLLELYQDRLCSKYMSNGICTVACELSFIIYNQYILIISILCLTLFHCIKI